MTFNHLCEFLQTLEKTSSRNEITRVLADLFRESGEGEIGKICYLVLGRIAPQYEGIEFNFAEKMMIRAISLAYDVEPENVMKKYKKVGDLGDAVEVIARSKIKNEKLKLSVAEVYMKLKEVAEEGGQGSQERKLQQMADLLKSSGPLCARYLARIPVGKLRLGFSDMTILDALSVMEVGDKSARKKIEAAYSVTADIGRIAERVKSGGVKGLGRVKAEAGVPIRTSLAERLPTAVKVAEKLGSKFAVEPKMDGFRVELHFWTAGKEKQVRIFSRNLENVTDMFPEIASAAKKLDVQSAIFDGEAIGYNPKTGKFVPFQETVQRKRKYGIDEFSKSVPLKVFVFDLLFLNGETFLDKPFAQRRERLEQLLQKTGDTIALTPQKVVGSATELKKFFDECIGDGLEGIVAKKLDVPYQAGGRGFHWVKYKKHTETTKGTAGLADTIDCVVMGAYRGRGKRAQFGVGGFLLGVPEGTKYYSLSNLGTGLTDKQFRQMYKEVRKLEVNKKPQEYVVDKTIEPDIWVKPGMVLEILADEITLSPRHTAGRRADGGKGLSLRFPRLMRIRDDKNPDQATAVREVAKLYKMQFSPPSRIPQE